MVSNTPKEVIIGAPMSARFIYLCRHLMNTQNLFLRWEESVHTRLNKKYAHLADGETIELEKISIDDFDPIVHLKAGKQTKPFVIKNFWEATDISWEELGTKYGDTNVPTHPKAEIDKDFNYHRPKIIPLAKAIEYMTAQKSVYVLACSQIFVDYPSLLKRLNLNIIGPWFNKKIIRREMFIGNSKVGSTYHCAGGDNFFLMVKGRKKWTFVSPANYIAMYPHIGRDREAFIHTSEVISKTYKDDIKAALPLYGKVTKYTVTLNPGDLLLNPTMWWHEVENLDSKTIGVANRALSGSSRRFELLAWLFLFRFASVNYILQSFKSIFTKENKFVNLSDKTAVNTYGGSRKKQT